MTSGGFRTTSASSSSRRTMKFRSTFRGISREGGGRSDARRHARTPPLLALSKPPDLLTPPRDNTRVFRQGTGKVHPTEDDLVKVRYVVWDLDGKIVDQVESIRSGRSSICT